MKNVKEKLANIIVEKCESTSYENAVEAVDEILKMTFDDLSEIVIKWMAENTRPHTKLLADQMTAEILIGVKMKVTGDHLVD